jgi:hypothetical protein
MDTASHRQFPISFRSADHSANGTGVARCTRDRGRAAPALFDAGATQPLVVRARRVARPAPRWGGRADKIGCVSR